MGTASRLITSLFILMVAAHYLVVGFDNITNPTNPNASNWPFVQGVLSGDGVQADSDRWNNAQKLTFLGGFLGLGVFFFGFMVAGGNWFIMYLNSKWNGLAPAFQNSVMTITMLILTVGVMIGGHFMKDNEDGRA